MKLAALPFSWRRVSIAPRLREAQQFLSYLFARIVRDACLQNAATLSYTTLLSLVPLLTVGFSVLAAFPVFEPLTDRIRMLIFTNLVPATGEVVQTYIDRFIQQAAGLTAAGFVALLVSALLLMSAIDKALNDIWYVRKRRRPLHGFMIYWTVLTLAPLLIGFSVLLTTYLDVVLEAVGPGLRQLVIGFAPFLAEVVLFSFLYSAVPNRRVRLGHAVTGAVVAAAMFELAKAGFGWYVSAFPAFEIIYGALATVPLFLIWIYLSWIIVLLGAEFTQALSGYRAGRSGLLSDPRLRLVLCVRLLGYLWHAQRRGIAVTRRGLLRREPEAGEAALQECLSALERARVIQRTERGSWILARDPSSYTLRELYRAQPFVLPDQGDWTQLDGWNQRLAEVLKPVGERIDAQLGVPLQRLFMEPENEQGG